MRNIILFGAGIKGEEAVKYIGEDSVSYFCDNDEKKIGTFICGKEVIPFNQMLSHYQEGQIIMITPDNKAYLRAQLEMAGVRDYLEYRCPENKKTKVVDKKKTEHIEMNNQLLDKYVEKARKLNLLEDFFEFKELTARLFDEADEKGIPFMAYLGGRGENHYYGNMENMLEYAGLDSSWEEYFPIISHNTICKDIECIYGYDKPFVYPGTYFGDKVHERLAYLPIFSVGPYINYASELYTKEEKEKVKEKYGRILTVFLPHSVENARRTISRERFIDRILQLYEKKFDSIWICLYWTDYQDDIIEYVVQNKLHIVSAGYRFDTYFLRRMRSIMELSEATISAELGGNVLYSLAMNTPVGRVDAGCDLVGDDKWLTTEEKNIAYGMEYQKDKRTFEKLFSTDLNITQGQMNFMDNMAGFDLVRSPEYIRAICEISKDITENSNRESCLIPHAVADVYYSYYVKKNFAYAQILKSACGGFLN